MKEITIIIFCIVSNISFAQNKLIGSLVDEQGQHVIYATCAIYNEKDSTLVKVESSDDLGNFTIEHIYKDSCYVTFSMVGLYDRTINQLYFSENRNIDLGVQIMKTQKNQLETVVISADRALIENKADRIVFNVAGTINSIGDNANQLLKKAPGINMGSNGAIKMLGRTGILLFIDGKNSGLTGDEMNQYLENINSDQIDRIEIIHSPGVKYDAQGMAGIIDVRLKKNEFHGINSDLSISLSQGKRGQATSAINMNFKNNIVNIFGSLGYGKARRWSDFLLTSTQNAYSLREYLDYESGSERSNYRLGMDYFLHPSHTVGFLGSRINTYSDLLIDGSNQIGIEGNSNIDSTLISKNISTRKSNFDKLNLNYKYDKDQTSLNLDIDYGNYFKDSATDQPNSYFESNTDSLLRISNKYYDSEINISIYSLAVDYESEIFGGKLGIGIKTSRVQTENEFLFYDIINSAATLNVKRSNLFDYKEKIYASYFSYALNISNKLNFSIGNRFEQTYSKGKLTVFDNIELPDPIENDYLNFFPNIWINFNADAMNNFTFSYSKRINRPNYRKLNPFKSQVNELGFDKGNPFLRPEIANNLELGYSLNKTYHFKLAFSKVKNKIVGLIGPDEESPLAGFLGYGNLASQEVINFSINGPFSVNEKWRINSNISTSYTNNSADYGQGITIATNAFNISLNQTHSFDLNKSIRAELSAWYNGSDIWDGIQFMQPNYSISSGIRCNLIDNQLSMQLNVSDIFYTDQYKGQSEFNGRIAKTTTFLDSRRISLRLRYKMGNNKIKYRKRVTGMESEQKRTR